MTINNGDLNELQKLEESLWIAKTRFDNDHMNRILAPDFFEFGRSGKIYDRAQSLSAPEQKINAKIPLKNFNAHALSQDIVLITYVSEVQYDVLEVGNRSSVWQRIDGAWRLRFHQGTPTTIL
jgi:hypothetical protein